MVEKDLGKMDGYPVKNEDLSLFSLAIPKSTGQGIIDFGLASVANHSPESKTCSSNIQSSTSRSTWNIGCDKPNRAIRTEILP